MLGRSESKSRRCTEQDDNVPYGPESVEILRALALVVGLEARALIAITLQARLRLLIAARPNIGDTPGTLDNATLDDLDSAP